MHKLMLSDRDYDTLIKEKMKEESFSKLVDRLLNTRHGRNLLKKITFVNLG